jgi:cysteine desulfurase
VNARPVYLDYHATTPVDPRVLDAMIPYFTERFGNAASRQHVYGWEAEQAVEQGRAEVASLIGARASEICFTSGATESNNLAIKGVAQASRERGNHLITVQTEHKSVLDSFHTLEREGFRVTYLPVNADGLVDLEELSSAITPRTVLVSVMAANNEIGVVQSLRTIADIAHAHGAVFHSDAAQAAGKVPIDVRAMEIDVLSLTGHKFYGPKGAGALFVRKTKPRLQLAGQIDGGGHENGLRSGTLNVPGIVGLGRAAAICRDEMSSEAARLASMRDRLLAGLRARVDRVRVNGSMQHRLPQNLHVSFADVEGEALLMALDGIAVSTGSACSSGSREPSHVLRAIGAVNDRAGASIRFGLGRYTTESEIDFAIERVATVVNALRGVRA